MDLGGEVAAEQVRQSKNEINQIFPGNRRNH